MLFPMDGVLYAAISFISSLLEVGVKGAVVINFFFAKIHQQQSNDKSAGK
jgi:hypothetical protein